MQCEHVTEKITLSKTLNTELKEEFKVQFQEMLDSSRGIEQIVYVYRSQMQIPRLKGESSVIYIGKANGSLYARYRSLIEKETNTFWDRYKHIMRNYGQIFVDVFKTKKPAITENKFLYDYHKQYYEAPPLNTQTYRESML